MIAKGKDCSDLFPAVVKNVVSKDSEVTANAVFIKPLFVTHPLWSVTRHTITAPSMHNACPSWLGVMYIAWSTTLVSWHVRCLFLSLPPARLRSWCMCIWYDMLRSSKTWPFSPLAPFRRDSKIPTSSFEPVLSVCYPAFESPSLLQSWCLL